MYHYQRLRDLREDKDLSQSTVANILQTTQQTYSLWEKGDRKIPFHHVITLARFYRVSIELFKNYQVKYLLTKNEWYEHKKPQKFANEKGLVVCPKVRLLDIIEPRRGENNYKSLMYKVHSKHIDFLICDQAMHIKAVIELGDNSHNQKDRQNRDAFVDQILTSVGYKVIRTHSITEDTLSEINNA